MCYYRFDIPDSMIYKTRVSKDKQCQIKSFLHDVRNMTTNTCTCFISFRKRSKLIFYLIIFVNQSLGKEHQQQRIFVRLGGFHFVMSFLGAVGCIISKNGLINQLESVYASNSVSHMLIDKAYSGSRAMRIISYQQLLLRLTCLIHPSVDRNKYEQDIIPT